MGSSINFGNIASMAIGSMLGGPIGAMAVQLFRQVAVQVIDQVIDQLPIDQGFKDILQAGFHAGIGDMPGALANINEAIEAFAQENGGSPSEVGQMQGAVDDFRDTMEEVMQDLVQNILDTADDNEAAEGGGSADGVPGWLYAMAKVMGEKLDEMSQDMMTAAENIDKEDPSTTTQFTVLSQQFSIAANSASTGLKAVGEGLSGLARKT